MTAQPQIIRSHRSSITLQVTPYGQVIVRAPYLMPRFFIQKYIQEKSEWIEKALTKVKKQIPEEKKYAQGEQFMYLGKPYALTLTNEITISVKENSLLFPKALYFRVQKELTNWYVQQAKEIITRRLTLRAQEMNTQYTGVFFSDTKSKWGTCGPDNSLQFNWRLVLAPLVVLDYVVIHELSHTKHKNHSRNFWQLVALYTPAFRQHRKWLNANAHLLSV